MEQSEHKRIKIKFYGGDHGIVEPLLMFLDPEAITHKGQGIDWSKMTIFQIRKIRKHMCPEYFRDRRIKCTCMLSWEWKSGY